MFLVENSGLTYCLEIYVGKVFSKTIAGFKILSFDCVITECTAELVSFKIPPTTLRRVCYLEVYRPDILGIFMIHEHYHIETNKYVRRIKMRN